MRSMMMAITMRIWMNPPSTWNPTKPRSQSAMRIIAIVVSIIGEIIGW
jgi:hypothetical protein